MRVNDNMDIQGSQTVSRDSSVGGDLRVGGRIEVGHDLRVRGWFEAQNVKGPNKGLFGSAEELEEVWPRPEAGWYAMVGDTLPAELWRSDGKGWKPTGRQTGEPTLDMSRVEEELSRLNTDLAQAESTIEGLMAQTKSLESAVENVRTLLATETAAVRALVDDERADRENAVAALRSAVDDEQADREAADTALDSTLKDTAAQLRVEQQNRLAQDEKIREETSAEIETRINGCLAASETRMDEGDAALLTEIDALRSELNATTDATAKLLAEMRAEIDALTEG